LFRSAKKALALVDRYLRDARPKLVPAGKQVNSPTLFINRRGRSLSRVGVWKILFRFMGRRAGLRIPVDAPQAAAPVFFATHLLEGGADLRSVQLMLGAFRYLPRRKIYTHVVGRTPEADLQSAFTPRA